MIPDLVPAGVYQHYKGEYYLVLGVARHSETDEKMVVYVPLYVREGPRMCVRPAEIFFDTVCLACFAQPIKYGTCPHSPNIRIPRFKYIGTEVGV